MITKHWKIFLLTLPLALGAGALATLPGSAAEIAGASDSQDQVNKDDEGKSNLSDLYPSLEENPDRDGMEQVTSVSQLRDVQPTDWAFQALQSLVERYGCIAGYPDRTYRGNRAMTRYEFAAGLNACLDRMNELISAATANLVKKEDLMALQKLQEEFAAELATLRQRVDALELRTTTLEEQQFSPTTKLSGTAIFSAADVFGGSGSNTNTFFQYRANFDLKTSFTGKDLLITSLFTGNTPALGVGFDLPATNVGGIGIPSAEGTLSAQFGANFNSQLYAIALVYNTLIGDKLLLQVAGGGFAPLNLFAPTNNPLLDDHDGGTGAISVFGQRNAIYSLGAGTGAGFQYFLSKQLTISGVYLADGFTANNPDRGLFTGGYSAMGQITWSPSKQFSIAGTYINAYFPPGRFGFSYNSLAVTGTAVANTLAGQSRLTSGVIFDTQPVITNSYGIETTFQITPGMVLSGWFGATYARLIGRGDGKIFNYAVTLGFPDLGKKGNLLGFVVGAEPYLVDFSGGNPQPFENDIPLHIEGFYRYQITDGISITPGMIWLTAPNQDNDNADDFIATIRMTFKF